MFNDLNFRVCLAPMVGLSHVAFRELLQSYLPVGARTLWPTEMLNSRRLPYERFAEIPELRRNPAEQGLVPQILGNEERFISESVRRLENEWGAEGIDINMGCPVRQALKHNYGVSLMGDPSYASGVVEMTVRNTRLPVSVKLRSGTDEEDLEYLLKFIRGLIEAGASWITLHPRLGTQGRRGAAKWSTICEVKKNIAVPVIGNGDVQTAQDVTTLLEQTGCDLVMVGRALTARPWLLWQYGEAAGFAPPAGRAGRAPQSPEEEGVEYGRSLKQMADLMARHLGEGLGLRRFRFYVRYGCHWLDFGNTLLGRLNACVDFVQVHQVLDEFFDQPVRMSQRTEWRN